MKIFRKCLPVLIILIVWSVFSSPYLLRGDVPYPAKFQNSFFSPWSSYEQYAVPVKNNALSDVVTQIYPWKHFTIEELKKGRIPWWNPYSFSGNPHAADLQTAVFSPFNLLFFILPFIDAWSILVLLQPLLAGLFTYLLLRKLKISKEAGLLGSIVFMFCGFIVVWMPYATLSMAIVFLPLALYAIESYFDRQKFFPLIILPISIAFSFFSGHIQTSLYFTLYVLSYIFFKFLITKNKKITIIILISFILGLVVSLIQILPALEIYRNSVRSELFSNQGAIPLQNLVTIFAPDFYGNPVTRNDWIGNYAEWAGFIGIIPLLLAFISLFEKKEKGKVSFFFIAGITAVLLAIGTPFQSLLVYLKLPVFSTSIPSRIIVLFSFSFAILAAYGLDNLKNSSDKQKVKKMMYVCLSFIGLVLFIWFLLFVFKALPDDKAMIAARNLIIPTLFLFIASSLIILRSKIKAENFGILILYSLIFITLIDSFRFAQKWVPFDPRKIIFPDVPVIEVMQEKVGTGRVFGKFGAYIDTYYHLPSIEGYDPLYIQRYGEFLASAKTGSYQPAVRSLAVLDKSSNHARRVLDLLGVNIIFHVIGDTGKEWAYPVWKKDDQGKYLYSVIYQDDKFQLYDNSTALSRTKLFYDYEIIKKDKDIIKRFYSGDFDFRNKIILEEDPPPLLLGKGNNNFQTSAREGKASIISYSPNAVMIDVYSPQPGFLFLSDNYYPNWKARVNGKETKIFRTDYTFRSVIVPKGESKVEFYYSGLL